MSKNLFILCLLIMGGVVAVSGCTSESSLTYEELLEEYGSPPPGENLAEWNRERAKDDYYVFLQNFTLLEEMTVETAKERLSPSSDDSEMDYTILDYGEKDIEGVTVYYGQWTTPSNRIEGEVLFEINSRWYSILWYDLIGNPNKEAIDAKISEIISKAKKVST